MSRRRVCVLIHRVTGLLLAGFLIVVGGTGACLAWRIQLERLFAPRLFVLDPHIPDGRRADPLWMRRQVELAYPWARVDMADLSSLPDVPLEYSLQARQPGDAAGLDDDAFADPYSGRVLGSRRYGDLRQGMQNSVPFIYNLHQELALGSAGTTCLGMVALLWTIDCFVGMYLSFPASRRKAGWSWSYRLTRWPMRFSPSFKIRWQMGGYRRLYDLHRASAVWLWLMLLIFAWTGVAFNLPTVYGRVMHILGGSPASEEQWRVCTSKQNDDADWAANLTQARKLMKSASEGQRFQVIAERFLSYDRATCRWTYRVRSSLDVDRIGNTQLTWQGGQDPRPIFSAPTGQKAADTFTTWIEAIHEAQTGGMALRLLVCLSGVTTVLLSVTGVLIFLRKMGVRANATGRLKA